MEFEKFKILEGEVYLTLCPLKTFPSIFEKPEKLEGYTLSYRNAIAMDKELLLLVGRHFEALKSGPLSFRQIDIMDIVDDAFLDAVIGPLNAYLDVVEFAQYLASYLALKDNRLEALHEVIRKVEEAAKGIECYE